MRERLRQSAVASALLSVSGALAWLTGSPLVFPSLGPSAYLLAVDPSAPTCRPRRVVGGHVVGIAGGLLAYYLLAQGLVVTEPFPPLSEPGFRLATSAALATGLTTLGMLVTDLRHAPACATTLIVSLGLLPTVREAAGIGFAVIVLVGVHAVGRALSDRAIP